MFSGSECTTGVSGRGKQGQWDLSSSAKTTRASSARTQGPLMPKNSRHLQMFQTPIAYSLCTCSNMSSNVPYIYCSNRIPVLSPPGPKVAVLVDADSPPISPAGRPCPGLAQIICFGSLARPRKKPMRHHGTIGR